MVLIESEIGRLGNARSVAVKAGVSESIISQMRKGGYDFPETWQTVGLKLGWEVQGWQVVETLNQNMVKSTLTDAKTNSMFIGILDVAGCGKSEGIRQFDLANKDKGCFTIRCQEWSQKAFLTKLATQLGVKIPKGYHNAMDIGEEIVIFFRERMNSKPILVIDEADKLKDGALRWLIHFYNELEDKVGLVMAGTEHLEAKIKRGVRYAKCGYDEIDSRFGRRYVKLYGATEAEVRNICVANGLTDRAIQKAIFKENFPVEMQIEGSFVKMIKDLRPVKRAIVRELL
jgi:hypothetical protein